MYARFMVIAAVASACSLGGLADGGGAGGDTASTSSIGGAGGQGGVATGAGGVGGEPPVSRFVWQASFGNQGIQATSPFSTDPHGSTLRLSAPSATGAVWVAFTTSGLLDPDGDGGASPAGVVDMQSLFLLELQPDGAVSAFRGYTGPPASVENGLSVDAITRDGEGVIVVGSFRTGSLDLGVGTVTQSNTGADDAFMLVLDADAEPIAARHITGLSNDTQTARAATTFDDTLYVGGKFRQSFSLVDPATDIVDAGCAFEDIDEVFDRAYVTSFDLATLACVTLYSFTAVDPGAAQQVFDIAVDDSGVYLAGSYTRQIIASPIAVLPSTSAEDGFVIALKPNLVAGARWVARATSSRGSANDALRAIQLGDDRVWVGGYLAAGTGTQTPTFGRLAEGTICSDLAGPMNIDGFVGSLDRASGDCIAARLLGGDGVDQVRTISVSGAGIVVGGFSDGLPGLETSIASPLTRNGFFARLDASLVVTGGVALGGTSLDYVDGVREIDGGYLVAGSFGAPFDFLAGQDDFFVGALLLE